MESKFIAKFHRKRSRWYNRYKKRIDYVPFRSESEFFLILNTTTHPDHLWVLRNKNVFQQIFFIEGILESEGIRLKWFPSNMPQRIKPFKWYCYACGNPRNYDDINIRVLDADDAPGLAGIKDFSVACKDNSICQKSSHTASRGRSPIIIYFTILWNRILKIFK